MFLLLLSPRLSTSLPYPYHPPPSFLTTMGKIHGNGNSPSATDLSPRSGAQKRPRSQLSNSSGGGGPPRNLPPSPPSGGASFLSQGARPLSWPPLYSVGGGAGAGPGVGGLGGHGGAAAAAAVNLSESLYGYAASPHQSSRFSQVGSGTSKKKQSKSDERVAHFGCIWRVGNDGRLQFQLRRSNRFFC